MEKIAYELIRSSRKTLSVEVDASGKVLVRSPRLMSKRRIEAFLQERADWIDKARQRQAKRQQNLPQIREEDKPLYVKRARAVLPGKIEALPSGQNGWRDRIEGTDRGA